MSLIKLDPAKAAKLTIADFEQRIQNRLDTFARTKTYDGILSACTYATSPTERLATEGQRAVDIRDATWQTAYQILADYQNGDIPQPTWAELEAQLPELSWE